MLTILKYAGLLLATVSSIWGTTNELTEKKNGKKVLTRSGYVAISFTVLGMLVSVGSNILEDHQRARERQRIVVAGQPLTSLSLRWEFHQIGSALEQRMDAARKDEAEFAKNQTGDVSEETSIEMNRMFELYPFLIDLSRNLTKMEGLDHASEPSGTFVLVLVALDESRNTILSLGKLDPSVSWSGKEDILSHKDQVLSGGVSYCQDGDSPCPDTQATRDIINWPTLSVTDGTPATSGKTFAVEWNLDSTTFKNSIDRQNSDVSLTGRLPATLKIAVLFNIQDLPFTSGNLALPNAYSLWAEPREFENFKTPIEAKPMSSSIQLIPNEMAGATYNYRLKNIYREALLNRDGEPVFKSDCLMFEFELLN